MQQPGTKLSIGEIAMLDNGKAQIIADIRALDWDSEYFNSAEILDALKRVELALNTKHRLSENLHFISLYNYILSDFIDNSTQKKFYQYLQSYQAQLKLQGVDTGLASARIRKKFLAQDDAKKMLDLDDISEPYLNTEDDDYNPVAVQYNEDLGTMADALDDLNAIEKNLHADFISMKPVAVNISAVDKKVVQEEIFYPVKPVAAKKLLLPHAGKFLGYVIGMAVAFSLLAVLPPLAPIIAAMTGIAVSTLVVSTIAMSMIGFVGGFIGSIVDHARKSSFRKKNAGTTAIDNVITKAAVVSVSSEKAPKNDEVQHIVSFVPESENIHDDAVADTVSQSRHSLFHKASEKPVEPSQILVSRFSLRH